VSSAAGMQGYHIDLYDFCLELISQCPNDLWVDYAYGGPPEYGTFDYPFNTLAEAVDNAIGGETIHIKAGSGSETITITKEVMIESYGGTATVGE